MHHSTWNLLFHNPEFWDQLSKRAFCDLRSVCKDFKATIPERDAMLCVFKGKFAKKVNLFRILPLSVYDMLRIKSPVSFIEAFKIAERKAGGFDNCLAIMRERGWHCWCVSGMKRAEFGKEIEASLQSHGIFNPPISDPLYQTAIQRFVSRVVVWRYVCTYETLMPWERYNPETVSNSKAISALMFRSYEYENLLRTFRHAVGYWYRGINHDVRSALSAIRAVRSNPVVTEHIHVLISNGALVVGVITFRHWQSPPRRIRS